MIFVTQNLYLEVCSLYYQYYIFLEDRGVCQLVQYCQTTRSNNLLFLTLLLTVRSQERDFSSAALSLLKALAAGGGVKVKPPQQKKLKL